MLLNLPVTFRRTFMKNKPVIFVFIALVYLFSGFLYGQDMTQLGFLSELDNKKTVTYGDAVSMFKIQTGVAVSKKKGSGDESFLLKGYGQSAPLTRGMAALMTAQYLDLGGSFMYLVFGSERYAYRACIANEIMASDGSENDIMNGPELIELFSKIGDNEEDGE
jgi:hypothetical protein